MTDQNAIHRDNEPLSVAVSVAEAKAAIEAGDVIAGFNARAYLEELRSSSQNDDFSRGPQA